MYRVIRYRRRGLGLVCSNRVDGTEGSKRTVRFASLYMYQLHVSDLVLRRSSSSGFSLA